MRLTEILLGDRSFYSRSEVVDTIKSTKLFESGKETLSEEDVLLIFRTSTQQSWLAFTNERIYFVLDDMQNKKAEVRWRLNRDKIIKGERVTTNIELEEKTENTGRLKIGEMKKGFLYSKRLFERKDITEIIYNLIENQMQLKSSATSVN